MDVAKSILDANSVVLPLYIRSEGVLPISTAPLNGSGGSEPARFVYAPIVHLETKPFLREARDRNLNESVRKLLEGEISRYNAYLQGEVYDFRLMKGEETLVFEKEFYTLNGALDSLNYFIPDQYRYLTKLLEEQMRRDKQ